MQYKTAHAACRGTSHIAAGIPCQDVTAAWQGEDAAAIVLCDGAGSCPHALEGAEAVAGNVLSLLQQWCRETGALTPEAVLYACLKALARNPYPAREQSCTLLFCGARADGSYVLGHIGDGCGFRSDGISAQLISAPENGSTPNETYFVTGAEALSHFRLTEGTLRPGETILLCSDGAGASLYNNTAMQPAPAVNRLSQWLLENPSETVSEALAENLDEVLRSHSHDDMSIALLTFSPADCETAIEETARPEFDPMADQDTEEIWDAEGADFTDLDSILGLDCFSPEEKGDRYV